jgi:AcrR family transcriptional regulator
MAKRSEASRQSILDATLRLLDDPEMTVKTLSIEAIAREAGVGKTTIYRWWPGKAAVLIDAFMENHLLHTPVREDVPVREALEIHLRSLIRQYAGPAGRLVAQILAESQYDPETREMFRERFFDDRYNAIVELVQRGIDRGELSPDLDPGLFSEALYAPVYQRLLIGHLPLKPSLAKQLVAQAFASAAPPARKRARA